jgi:hypothetical protein
MRGPAEEGVWWGGGGRTDKRVNGTVTVIIIEISG